MESSAVPWYMKPCPFCGDANWETRVGNVSDDKITPYVGDTLDWYYAYNRCNTCGAQTPTWGFCVWDPEEMDMADNLDVFYSWVEAGYPKKRW